MQPCTGFWPYFNRRGGYVWGVGCSLVCSAHPAQAALLSCAPRLALLCWLVGCSVVRLGGWLGLCVIARGSFWLKPRRLKCRRTCNLSCWVLVVAWWFWAVLAGLGVAWLCLPGVSVGGCRVRRLAVLAWVCRSVRALCCWFGAARWLSGWLWWPPGLVLSLVVWLGSVLLAVVSVLVGWWCLAAVVGWCCRRCGVCACLGSA